VWPSFRETRALPGTLAVPERIDRAQLELIAHHRAPRYDCPLARAFTGAQQFHTTHVTDARDVIIFDDYFSGRHRVAIGRMCMTHEEGDVEDGSRKGPVRSKPTKAQGVVASTGTKSPRAKATSNAPVDRETRIRMAAYLRAERRGFAPGCELDDWIAAELEISGQDTAPTPATPTPRTTKSATRKPPAR
jgi:hypothetical protein